VGSADHDRCAGSRDIVVSNGKIVTEDGNKAIISAGRIKKGRVAALGDSAHFQRGDCTRSIDVQGCTVAPGLIDKHNHFRLSSRRPGHGLR
jgi:predicted amidohydrolase YtcJ